MAKPVEHVSRVIWKGGAPSVSERAVPNEVAIAITYGGSTQAVMMATPADLEDFALGFSTTEGLIRAPADISSLEVIESEEGIELRMWLVPERGEAYSRRRRLLAGPTGCGLCGIESLTEAVKPARRIDATFTLPPAEIEAAMAALPAAQKINRETRAVHAAGFWVPGEGLLAVREDVGRHNALDKLVGHIVREGRDGGSGVIVLTSRVSVEMVQKAAVLGAPVIAAVSAPTGLAIRMAEEAGITLVAIARDDSFEVFTHPDRIAKAAASTAA